MKKKREESGGANDWLNTYADMVTLVLTFFIMLFSSSSVEESKWREIVNSFSKEAGKTSQVVFDTGEGENISGNKTDETDLNSLPETTDKPSDFNQLYEYLKNYINENDLAGSVEIKKDKDNVMLRVKDNLFFLPDMSELRSESYGILTAVGKGIKSLEDKIDLISINGHTASVNNYDASIDRALSSQRANNVLVYWESRMGIDPKKLQSVGYGRNFPIAPNDNEENMKKNRRVDILIIGKDSEYNNITDIQKIIGSDIID